MTDYSKCKAANDNLNERYALPNIDKVLYAFYIKPLKSDTLQRGIAQPANEKPGGGRTVYFAKGTADGTLVRQKPY
jgi:hypothetical protein